MFKQCRLTQAILTTATLWASLCNATQAPMPLATDDIQTEDTITDILSPFDPEHALIKQLPEDNDGVLLEDTAITSTNQGQQTSPSSLSSHSLSYTVENKTGKTVYVTAFTYLKRHRFNRWRWYKSPIVKLEPKALQKIEIPCIENEDDRNSTFGYLAVFDTFQEADDAVYELTPDSQKIDLDILAHLQDKKVVLEIEKYGKLNDFYDFDFVKKTQDGDKPKTPELDFMVENQTGKTIHVVGFTFQKKAKGTWLAQKTKEQWTTEDDTRDDMSSWRYDKLPMVTLAPGEKGLMDVDTIIEERDRKEVQGFLAIFDEDELQEAKDAVYELLPEDKKITLGRLQAIKKKKIIINVKQYGTFGDLIDFQVKPAQRIDFKKIK